MVIVCQFLMRTIIHYYISTGFGHHVDIWIQPWAVVEVHGLRKGKAEQTRYLMISCNLNSWAEISNFVSASTSALWQYGLWSFQTGGTKLERFLHKNKHAQRKLLYFDNWINGGLRSFRKNQSFKNQLFSSSHLPN